MPGLQKIPLFGTGIKAISPTLTAQRRVNCYFDYRVDQENNPIVLVQTPGLTRLFTLPTAPIRGVWQAGSYAFVVAGIALYLIQQSGFTFLGTFGPAGATRPVQMTNDINSLAIVDGVSVYSMPLDNLVTAIATPGAVISGLVLSAKVVAQL